MLEVLFSFLVHTFSGGLSRVASAMSLSPTRSRSPRNTGSVHDDKAEEPKENPEALTQVGLTEQDGLPEAPAQNEGSRGELATPAEEAAGKQLLEAVVSASRSLTVCAQELEKNCNLLSDVKDSAVALESLAAGVNYYASTTKAANSSQAQAHKQIQWDWLSATNERTPMRDVIKSIKTHCENTGKASYELAKTSRQIVDIIQSNNQLMKEQCQVLQAIGENQKKLAEIMQGVIEPPQTGGPPTSGGSSGPGGISPPAPGYMPCFPPGTMPHMPPVPSMPPMTPTRAKFWQYQPVVAPSMEPNESRNPPSAAYAAQECPAKNPGALEVLGESGNQRTVSPTGRSQEQIKSLNAAYVPKGWMLLPSGSLHRLYAWDWRGVLSYWALWRSEQEWEAEVSHVGWGNP